MALRAIALGVTALGVTVLGVIARREIRRQATRIAAVAIVLLCAPFGDQRIRAEQNVAPPRSGAPSPAFSGPDATR